MKRAELVVVLLFAVGASAARKPCPAPVWTIDLAGKYGFRPFAAWESGRLRPEGLQTRQGLKSVWEPQQGVVFISPEKLAVYQVLATDMPPVAGRDVSGGGGKFILQVLFLDTTRGEEARTFRLITSGSELSEVYPTHDGKVLIRTGQIMRLYSATFEEIASGPLRLLSDTDILQWRVSVSPSGRLIYEQYIAYARTPSESTIIKRILLDADTLEAIPNPRLSDVALWPGGASLFNDRVMFVFPSRFIDGVYTPDGKWLTFDGAFKQSRNCQGGPFALEAISSKKVADQLFAKYEYGCKQLKLFLPDGQLFWDAPVREEVFSVLGNANLLAVRTAHSRWDPLDLGLGSKPLHIVLYDLTTKSEKCSIRTTKLPYYAVSPTGTVAVIQGSEMSLYQP